MFILQTFNKPGGARRISTPMHTALLRSPHTDLTLPPVAPQKCKRDSQVKFRGRRRTAPLFQRSSSRTFLKGCNPSGWRGGTRRLMFLPPGSPASNGPVSYVWLLSDIPGVVPLHPLLVYHDCAALPLIVPYA
ncbi:hypothetical protein T03_15393, partial [Trichinella britovi]